MRAHIAMLEPQVAQMESDWVKNQQKIFNEKVQTLEVGLREKTTALKKIRKAGQTSDSKLASERIEHEGALADAARAAAVELASSLASSAKQLKGAMNETATKVRVIERRDASLDEAYIRERGLVAELAAVSARCNAAELVAETVPALELKLSHVESLCAERGRQVKKLCGGMGGRPHTQRTDAELTDCPQSTGSHCKASMTQRMLEVLGDGKMATTAVVAALRLGGYLQAVPHAPRSSPPLPSSHCPCPSMCTPCGVLI